MTDSAPDPTFREDALGMLDSAGQLVARAVRMALVAFPENSASRFADDQALARAAQLATIAAASARVAHGLIAAEHVDLLRAYEERVDSRYDDFLNAARTMADEDGRSPYEPPTLTGPWPADHVCPDCGEPFGGEDQFADHQVRKHSAVPEPFRADDGQ